ncbi:MAG TPA: flagella basal body P-ring formation protein FlgA, partial [Alcanivorax sp.]|nr:flagella basal body P-ring formation protein FlgA [Alcanivorax sp.]
ARPLSAGTVIQSHQLRKPALVERRQAVTLVAGGEGFRISREGHALDDGALGGRVRVRLSNREVVTAQVTGPGRARVVF